MRSSAALLIAVVLSVSAVPVPDDYQVPRASTDNRIAYKPATLNVYKHRHIDGFHGAAARRDQNGRLDTPGDGHHQWPQHGSWSGPWSQETGGLPGHGHGGRHHHHHHHKPCHHSNPTSPPTGDAPAPPAQTPDQPNGPPAPGPPPPPQQPTDIPSPTTDSTPTDTPTDTPPDAPPPPPQPPTDAPDAPPPAPTDTTTDAQTEPPTPAPSDPPPPPSDPNADAYLAPQNQARSDREAGRPLMEWDSHLADLATQWSSKCNFEHSGGSMSSDFGYGENIAAGSGQQAIADAVASWVNERDSYDPANPMNAGHWTQIVWKSTTKVGCGYADCTTNTPFGDSLPVWRMHTCMYTPPGNVVGDFDNGV